MSSTATAQPSTFPLQPFSAVHVCAPFAVHIKPGNGYFLTIDAEQSVKDALSTVVGADGTLALGTKKVSGRMRTATCMYRTLRACERAHQKIGFETAQITCNSR